MVISKLNETEVFSKYLRFTSVYDSRHGLNLPKDDI